nr:uncharacterized protein LOC113802289 [Penaeus vannamei]
MGRRRIQRCTTPELKDVLLESSGGRWFRPVNGYDVVFPGILLGDASTSLKDIGVTHVLNAAQGHNNEVYRGYVSTTANYYKKKGIFYLGIPAMDMPGFYLKPYFREAADFIQHALQQGGKVLVHCQCGISRSASLVAGFLMLRRGMNVQTALATISKKRSIFPNQGFLSQLCDLDYELRRSGEIPDSDLPDRRGSLPYRETSPFRNPSAYPRFTLVPYRTFETYSDTKTYVPPRRSSSVDRYEAPAKPFAHNPLVDSKTYGRTRSSTSPVRYTRSPSVSYTKSFIDDDEEEPINTKVFDTYKRYVRSSTTPLPSSVYRERLARILDYYVPPRNILYETTTTPYSYSVETYYPDRTYQYINNLNKYYDTYRYMREPSPVRAYSPVPERRPYSMVPLRGYHSGTTYVSTYPYTEKYFPTICKYPATARALNTATMSTFATLRA